MKGGSWWLGWWLAGWVGCAPFAADFLSGGLEAVGGARSGCGRIEGGANEYAAVKRIGQPWGLSSVDVWFGVFLEDGYPGAVCSALTACSLAVGFGNSDRDIRSCDSQAREKRSYAEVSWMNLVDCW